MKIDETYMVDLEGDANSNNSGLINHKYNIDRYARSLDEIEEIIIHCTANDTEAWNDPRCCIRYDLAPNHISNRGCPTATYHFYINKPGNVYQLVTCQIETMNCAGHNKHSVAVCIHHGAVTNNVTPEQMQSLAEVILYIFGLLEWQISYRSLTHRVRFHRDYNPHKSCPGNVVYADLINLAIILNENKNK